jgi:hypothetical protein
MAKHKVELALPKAADIASSDASIVVSADGRKIGELGLSRGGVTWWPRGAKRAIDLTWEQFAKHMKDAPQ